MRGIVGLEGKEPVGAVLTIGTKGPSGAPIEKDRFFIKVPDSVSTGSGDGVKSLSRALHPAFAAFNGAAPEHRRSIQGVLVHAREPECFEYHRKAQKLPPPFRNHSKLPACIGDGKVARRLQIVEGMAGHRDIVCPNELCEFAQQPNERTPPACKPWARILFQPIWKDGSKLPTPLMKFTTQSWHSIKAILGFFEYFYDQAELCGLTEKPPLFGMPFELTLSDRSDPEKKTRFPVIRMTPTTMIQAFLIGQAQRGAQLAEHKQYIALLDAPEQEPGVLFADHAEVEPAQPRS